MAPRVCIVLIGTLLGAIAAHGEDPLLVAGSHQAVRSVYLKYAQ